MPLFLTACVTVDGLTAVAAKFSVLRPSVINQGDQAPKPRVQRVIDADGQDRTPARLMLLPNSCDVPQANSASDEPQVGPST